MTNQKNQLPADVGSAPGQSGAESKRALDQQFSLAYEELRRLAYSVRRGDPSLTLTPTALVNEAWMKLAGSHELSFSSRLHFKRVAARAMRQLLVEAARNRNAHKRAGEALPVTFDESLAVVIECGRDVVALHHALEALARFEPRQAMLVECRFFGGFEVAETAELLGISEATALRDWRAAKAWLATELRRAS